jgi:hypothetical protein
MDHDFLDSCGVPSTICFICGCPKDAYPIVRPSVTCESWYEYTGQKIAQKAAGRLGRNERGELVGSGVEIIA